MTEKLKRPELLRVLGTKKQLEQYIEQAEDYMDTLEEENKRLKSEQLVIDLPVVPQFVAEFLEENDDCDIQELFEIEHFELDSKNVEKSLNWREKFPNEFALAKVIGYEVKEKKYELQFPRIGTFNDYASNLKSSLGYASVIEAGYTEAEIKAIDERYLEFAVEVKDE
ncbi:DUF1642 domain-containing protein [Lactococcus nasutitermitis]|uniref:DUF1642 domain-containing protein n=1 Tax=Lactococcus nasutitermitis TaxID=1652957 RepID=A0ABV9JGR2_9LACT|nr:DUF1642 domain-containing protein [Lactococcus nasutitermitis]